jgi:hypothetical protein
MTLDFCISGPKKNSGENRARYKIRAEIGPEERIRAEFEPEERIRRNSSPIAQKSAMDDQPSAMKA